MWQIIILHAILLKYNTTFLIEKFGINLIWPLLDMKRFLSNFFQKKITLC